MDDISVAYKVLLGLCGGIVAVGGAILMIDKIFKKPQRQLKAKVKCLEDEIIEIKRNEEKIVKTLDDVTETNRELCRGVVALLNHVATGNSISAVKKARDDLNEHLVDSLC